MMQKPIAILVTGRTYPSISDTFGGFDDWIAAALDGMPFQKIAICDGAALPDPSTLAGAIITGSHAMVTDRAPWSEDLASWLRQAVSGNLPLLGICYGHQLVAHAFGGHVGSRVRGIEFGTVSVTLTHAATEDAVFGTLPATFPAHVVHLQSVLALPPEATVLGYSAGDPHQIIRFAARVWGVQFHPEFAAGVIAGYAQELGLPPQGARRETTAARNVIGRFARLDLAATSA